MPHETHLREAIDLARASVAAGGGPFGALVVRDGIVVGRGENRVVPSGDPTAHAEVVAIRKAARLLGTHVLADCVLYASCEPCPMCLAAAHWARVRAVYFACSREDAGQAGFDDALLYAELGLPFARRRLPISQALRTEGLAAFRDWSAKEDRVEY